MMQKARLIFNEEGTITAEEIVQSECEHMEFLVPDGVDHEHCTAVMETLMSAVMGKPVKLQVIGAVKVEKLKKDKEFLPIGKPFEVLQVQHKIPRAGRG